MFSTIKNQTQRAQQPKSIMSRPNWEYLPNWESDIQTHPMPSILFCPPRGLENSELYVNMLYLLYYTFFSIKNQAQRAQERKWAAKPTGTACLIGNTDIWNACRNALPLPPAPPRALKHPRWVYNISFIPKYKKSCPQSPPNKPSSECTTRPPLLALFTCIC